MLYKEGRLPLRIDDDANLTCFMSNQQRVGPVVQSAEERLANKYVTGKYEGILKVG